MLELLKGRREANRYRIHADGQRQQLRLLLQLQAGGLSRNDWHDELEHVAPELRRAWLVIQSLSNKEVVQVA